MSTLTVTVARSVTENFDRIYLDYPKMPYDPAIDVIEYETDQETIDLLKASQPGAVLYASAMHDPNGNTISLLDSPQDALDYFEETFEEWYDDDGHMKPRLQPQIDNCKADFLVDPSKPQSIYTDYTAVYLESVTVSTEPPTVDDSDPEAIAYRSHMCISYDGNGGGNVYLYKPDENSSKMFDTERVASIENRTKITILNEARILRFFPTVDMFEQQTFKMANR